MSAKKHTKRHFWLLTFLIGLIAVAAGLFLLIGVTTIKVAEHELSRTNRSPNPTTGFHNATFSFGNLAGRTLNPAGISVAAGGISGVHGLGVFDGALYVSSWTDRAVYKIDLATGQQRQLADELNGAHDMALDDTGRIVTPLFGEDRVVRIDPKSGRVSELARGFSGPNGIAKARDGGFYISNAKAGTVVKVSKDGKSIRTIATGLKEPAGIISDPDNILYVAQYGDPVNSVVQVWDNGQVKPLVTGLTGAETLLRDDERNLIIGYVANGRAALSFFKRGGTAVQPLLTTDQPGPMVGPVTDRKYLYFESAGGSTVYRIRLP